MLWFLDVVLPIPLERRFTYQITQEEAHFIKKGMRIAVPFGKSKIYTALAFGVHNEAPLAYEAKPIYQILDESPLVNEIQFKHWQWIAEYYMCTLGEVIRSALPSAFLLESETLILPNKDSEIDDMGLKDDEFLIFEALQYQSALRISEVAEIVDKKNVLPLVSRLVQKGVVLLKEELYEQYKPKKVKFVQLASDFQSEVQLETLLDELSRAPQQSKALLALFQLRAKTKKANFVKGITKRKWSF